MGKEGREKKERMKERGGKCEGERERMKNEKIRKRQSSFQALQ